MEIRRKDRVYFITNSNHFSSNHLSSLLLLRGNNICASFKFLPFNFLEEKKLILLKLRPFTWKERNASWDDDDVGIGGRKTYKLEARMLRHLLHFDFWNHFHVDL